MTQEQQTTKPEMTVHAGEGMNISDVGSVIAMCYNDGGWVQAILFTGNKMEKTMDPNVVRSKGVYSAIWLLPKEAEPGGNGETLEIAGAEDGPTVQED